MEGIAVLVIVLFLITFGPPVIFFIIGAVKWNKNRSAAKVFCILGAVWFLVGGGMCASMMGGI